MYILIATIATKHYSCNISLIRDYLKANYLTTMLFVSCGNETNPMKTLRDVHEIWINVWDISDEAAVANFNYDRFFRRYSHPHGVVINLDCNKTNLFMAQISNRTLFHNERYWLMVTTDLENTFSLLSIHNINVDAEINIAVPVDVNYAEEIENYKMYEVFNPSKARGGRMNVMQLGNWNKISGFEIPCKQTKSERRRNLHGITLASVISVIIILELVTIIRC